MSDTVSIYGLVNPIDESIFYIGVTSMTLKSRLDSHISIRKLIYKTGIEQERVNYISQIIKNGFSPKIILLKEVEFKESDYYERYFYNIYLQKGCYLIQDSQKFNYHKSKVTRDRTEKTERSENRSIKRVNVGFDFNMYNKILKYGDDNGLDTFISSLKFIVNQYLDTYEKAGINK